MTELPTHFVAQEPSNPDSTSEQLPEPKLLQARVAAQTIKRFQILEQEILNIPNPQEQADARAKLDALAKREYGKAWEILNMPGVEAIPMVIGGKTGAELELELIANRIAISDSARELLHHPDFEANRVKTPTPSVLVKIPPLELGFARGVTTDQFHRVAARNGLRLVSPDTGPILRLQSEDTNWVVMGMQPIVHPVTSPHVFYLGGKKNEPLLDVGGANPDDRWSLIHPWVFALPIDQLMDNSKHKATHE